MKKASYRFIFRGLLALSPVLLFVLATEVFLWMAGETVPIRTVALEHDRFGPPAAYLPGVFGQQFNRYHFERIQKLHPKLLILGSSHVTRFREEMFRTDADFYNCGRTISCVGDLEEFLAVLPPDYAPKTLLLAVDSWWFNPNVHISPRFASDVRKDDTQSVNAHLYAYKQLLYNIRRGKLTWPLVVKVLMQRDEGIKRYGLVAWKNAGMRNDGSAQTFDRSTPDNYHGDLPDELDEIVQVEHPSLVPAKHIDEERVRRFVKALEGLERRGTTIIGFAPPFASEVREAYAENPVAYGFFAEYQRQIPEAFGKHGWYFYDASDPSQFGMDDRCMKDRDHAQETFHIALLSRMAQNPKVRDALHVDPAYLNELLSDPRTTSWYPVYPPREKRVSTN